MAGRGRSHSKSLRKPHLMEWVNRQEPLRKQVLLHIFGGISESECAYLMHMTVGEVRAIERWCADEGPTFAEDDYVRTYYATSSREEFCRLTGLSGGVYRFMELRYSKRKRLYKNRAKRNCDNNVSTGTKQNQGQQSKKKEDRESRSRRQERRAARKHKREDARAQRRAELDGAFPGLSKADARNRKNPSCSTQEKTEQHKAPSENSEQTITISIDELVGMVCAAITAQLDDPLPYEVFAEEFQGRSSKIGLDISFLTESGELHRILERDRRTIWLEDDSFWFFDYRRHSASIRDAVELMAHMNVEYSTRLFYRSKRDLMREIGIKAPEELYEILRCIYTDSESQVVFGNHLSFGFGKIDRQRQVKRFVAERPGKSKRVLSKEYEREYGFPADIVEVWLDLFAWSDGSLCVQANQKNAKNAKVGVVNKEPIEIAADTVAAKEADWIVEELSAASIPYVDNRPKGGGLWVVKDGSSTKVVRVLRSEGANFRYTAAGGRATQYRPGWWVSGHPERLTLTAAESKDFSLAQTEPDAACQPVEAALEPRSGETPHEIAARSELGPETPTIVGFLQRELAGDICDAGLVRARFAYEFPDERDNERNDWMLAEAGYYEDRGLLFRCGRTPNEHFMRLLSSHPSFSKGDPGFENAVWKHPAFRYVLRKALASHQVLLYERPDSYISFSRLHDVLGTRMADIEGYASAVVVAVPERIPFTISSLRDGLAFTHSLDDLDMPNAFYEGLLGASGLFQSCTMADTRVFETGVERLSANTFIEWFVSGHEGIVRDDVPRLLAKEYGIDYPMSSLITAVYNSSVYHDDVGDAYYSSMEVWKQEARNELAQ